MTIFDQVRERKMGIHAQVMADQQANIDNGPSFTSSTLHWPVHGLSFILPPKALAVERAAALKELRWIIGCFAWAIEHSYNTDSIRRPEMERKIRLFLENAWQSGQLEAEEFDELARCGHTSHDSGEDIRRSLNNRERDE